jgi:hypothetical protein
VSAAGALVIAEAAAEEALAEPVGSVLAGTDTVVAMLSAASGCLPAPPAVALRTWTMKGSAIRSAPTKTRAAAIPSHRPLRSKRTRTERYTSGQS